MKTVWIVLGGLAVVILIIVLSAVGSYNGLVGASQRVDQQWAQVQNVYQRRADLIPNLVQTVSGSANFEKSTLTAVIDARASATKVTMDASKAPTDPAQLQAFEQAQGQLSGALSRLLVVSERYPDLKASQSFLTLQAQLEGTENRISVERGNFNAAVQEFNTKVQRFPTVVMARLFGFTPKPYFAATAGAQTAPEVKFDFSSTQGTGK